MAAKLLQVNAVYNDGSTGTIVRLINAEAEKAGFECFSACPDVEDGAHTISMGTTLERKFHGLMARVSGKEGFYSTHATRKLIRWMKKNKPDVIHLHNLHSHFINLDLLTKYIAKMDIPTVITMHDCWYYTGKCCHYTLVGCQNWKKGCGNCKKLGADVPILFGDPTAKICRDKVDALVRIPRKVLVGVSDWMADEAKASLLKDVPITRVYNSIDADLFSRRNADLRKKYQLNKEFVILGFANKFLLDKNKQALDAIVSLIGKETAFVIAGCSEEQLKTLPTAVIGIGRISQANSMAELYSMADVMVNVTWEDSLSLVNVEALACGTPVITYASCGATETVEPAFRVTPGDVAGLVKKIECVRRVGKEGYTRACRQRAIEMFSNTYVEYIDIYKKLISD